jgi:hypothetical protein
VLSWGTALAASATGRGKTSVAIIESVGIAPISDCVEKNEVESLGERMISDTGRVPRAPLQRGLVWCGGAGDWTPDDRRRRNRFAFSRGPASFLSREPRRVCFGNCSSTFKHTERRRMDRVRIRLESDNEGTAKYSDGARSLIEPDRDEICGGIM